MKIKANRKAVLAVIFLIIAACFIYMLFFAYIPRIICCSDETSYEISEQSVLKECPDAVLTEYDREFLDNLINDSRILQLEDSDGYNSLKFTADEAGLQRYIPRADENYTVNADYRMYGISPLSASIQFEYTDGIYKEKLYISVRREETGNVYTKAVTVQRFDGKYIKQYWNRNGDYTKETYRYGLINHINAIIDGIMSV